MCWYGRGDWICSREPYLIALFDLVGISCDLHHFNTKMRSIRDC